MTKSTHFFLLIFLILLLLPSSLLARMVSISGDNVNLRSGPGQNFSIKWKYGNGFPLQVLQEQGKWLKVEDFENDIGWLHSDLTSDVGHMIVKVNKGGEKKINIRSGPGTNYNIVGKAYYGVVFKTLKQENGWAQVKHESGLEGWIKRSLLWGF